MGEPMGLQELFFGAMAGATVVVAGALYALFFALAKLHQSRLCHIAAWLAYGLLMASTYVLVWALKLDGFWLVVTSVMLLGYLVAPWAIWHLSVGTHGSPGFGTNHSGQPEMESRATQ